MFDNSILFTKWVEDRRQILFLILSKLKKINFNVPKNQQKTIEGMEVS